MKFFCRANLYSRCAALCRFVAGADGEAVDEVPDFGFAFGQRLFVRIQLIPIQPPARNPPQAARGSHVGHVVPIRGGFAARAFGECDVGRKRDVVQDAPARGTAGEAVGVVGVGFNVGGAAGAPDHGVSVCGEGRREGVQLGKWAAGDGLDACALSLGPGARRGCGRPSSRGRDV